VKCAVIAAAVRMALHKADCSTNVGATPFIGGNPMQDRSNEGERRASMSQQPCEQRGAPRAAITGPLASCVVLTSLPARVSNALILKPVSKLASQFA
jgi:hypothetical protein